MNNSKVYLQIQRMLPKYLGWCSIEKAYKLSDVILDNNLTYAVELGCFGGSSILPQALAFKHLSLGKVIGIDAWEREASLEDMHADQNIKWWGKLNYDEIKDGLENRLNTDGLFNYVELIKAKTDEVVNKFDDESIDLLHIDGNHSEIPSYRDATQWLPKVKKGGWVVFDDLSWSENGKNTTLKAYEFLLTKCKEDCVVNDCSFMRKYE